MNIHTKILSFSAVETTALALWLAILGPIGLLILDIGLSVEHWMSYNTNRGKKLFNVKGVPFGKIIGFSTSETIIWALWILIFQAYGFIAGAIFLTALLIPQHKVELNVVERKPLFRQLLSTRTVLISAIEGIGGTLWGALAQNAGNIVEKITAVLVLLAVMQLEHEEQAEEIRT